MHVKVLGVVKEVDTQFFGFKSLYRRIRFGHIRRQQLLVNSSSHEIYCTLCKIPLTVRHRFPYLMNVTLFPPLQSASQVKISQRQPIRLFRGRLPRRVQCHRHGLPIRINITPPIKQFLDALHTIQPNKRRSPTFSHEQFSIFSSPTSQ